MNRLKEHYQKTVVPALQKGFSYKNPHQVPRLVKIVVSMGVGSATQNKAILDNAVKDMEQITGRKAIVTKARKSISNFKLRQGMPIGCSVTLRKDVMYEFFDRLVNVALPKVRDFRGISASAFDGRGNYSIGLHEQIIFPEIEYDKIEKIKGMNITIVTSARTDEEARVLLRLMGVPFKN